MDTTFELKKHKEENKLSNFAKVEIALTTAGIVVAAAARELSAPLHLYIIAYVLIGHEIVFTAFNNLRKGVVMPNLLITAATVGAFILGNHIHSIGILLFFRIGEQLQKLAIDKSKRRIAGTLNLKSEFVNLRRENEVRRVSPDDIKIGDIIIVKAGERVALDGRVSKGESVLDMSALTGESRPQNIRAGEPIFSGAINLNNVLEIEVTSDINNSTISKIIELINDAAAKKSKAETFVAKFSKIYTPIVTLVSVFILLSPIVIKQATFADSLSKSLTFLVISVPCSLVLSIPLAYFIAIGVCGKRGILVKGSNYLDAVNSIDTIVFDKTGTLTKGVFKIASVSTEKGFEKEEVLKIIALAECFSGHYIAKSILEEVAVETDTSLITAHEEIAGFGIKAVIDGRQILVGNFELLLRENVAADPNTAAGTKVYLSVDGVFAGCVVLSDELKEDSVKLCERLRELGIKNLVMLTGDNEKQADSFAKILGIDKVYANLFPQDKVNIVGEIKGNIKDGGKTAFVGDGINDAPVLAVSDIGIAMGNGADIAIEAADIILMTDEPYKISHLIKVARETRKMVTQVVIVTIFVKLLFLSLTWGGVINLFAAICSDLGMSLLSVLACIRILNIKE